MSPAPHPDFDDDEPPWESDGSDRVDTSAPITPGNPAEALGDPSEVRSRPGGRSPAKAGTTFCQTPVTVITDRRLRDKEARLYDWLDWKAGATGVAKASYREMAEALGCSVKTIQRSLPPLLKVGRLVVEREPAGHGRGWYRVINEHRRPDTLVPSTGEPEGTELSDDGTNLSGEEGLERTSVSPLLESFEESGQESEQPTARELVDDGSGGGPEGPGVDDLPMVDHDEWPEEVPLVLPADLLGLDGNPEDDLASADRRWLERAGAWDRDLAGPCSMCGRRTGRDHRDGWLCSRCASRGRRADVTIPNRAGDLSA